MLLGHVTELTLSLAPIHVCKQVLDRFPLMDYSDTTLPPQVAMFAHPEGLTCKRQAPLPIFFTIVFTSNEGRRVYASVLTFHDVLQQVRYSTPIGGTNISLCIYGMGVCCRVRFGL